MNKIFDCGSTGSPAQSDVMKPPWRPRLIRLQVCVGFSLGILEPLHSSFSFLVTIIFLLSLLFPFGQRSFSHRRGKENLPAGKSSERVLLAEWYFVNEVNETVSAQRADVIKLLD